MNIEPIADKSKLKAGDRVVVEAVIKEVCGTSFRVDYPGSMFHIPAHEILGVIPRPLEPGDWIYSGWLEQGEGTIIAIHKDNAWVEVPTGETWTVPLNKIRRAGE